MFFNVPVPLVLMKKMRPFCQTATGAELPTKITILLITSEKPVSFAFHKSDPNVPIHKISLYKLHAKIETNK